MNRKLLLLGLALVLAAGCVGTEEGGAENANLTNSSTAARVNISANYTYGSQELGANWSENLSASDTNSSNNETRPKLAYFYRNGCSACAALSGWMANESAKYDGSLEWNSYDIDEAGQWTTYLEFSRAYGVPDNETYIPMVFIGKQYLWGIDGIENGLENAVNECLQGNCTVPADVPETQNTG
ncbi:MAG: hypothetical protein PHS02_00500 [Candidatus ainarchaeum sp.]|nr:hypothetical protein [Candidatus ainarchaeum sp.]